MKLWNTIHGFKFFSKTSPNVGTDIFFYQQFGDRWILNNEKDREAWPRNWFKLEEIKKITREKFRKLKLNLPGNPKR